MPKFIFVIGSSGTGKSTVSAEIQILVEKYGLTISVLNLDHYYLPKSMIDPDKPKNFDVPEALQESLIRTHLEQLEAGKTILRPTYDMPLSDRIVDGEVEFLATDVIVVEGIFAGEYMPSLKRDTDKLKVYVQSPQVNDNYTRKAERDAIERKKSEEHIRLMRKNQIGCLFQYVAPHMNSSQIVIDNDWQPIVSSSGEKVIKPMIVDDKLKTLLEFLSLDATFEPDSGSESRACSSSPF